MSDFNIQFEEQDQSITLEFEQIGGGAVKSVNGKTGAVVLDAGDLEYDDTETYSSGSVGGELSTLKDGFDDLDDRVTALEQGGSGSGLTEDIKQALLQIAEKVAYIDDHGQDYYDALEDALYPPAELVRISAVYTQSGTVYDTADLNSLRDDLVVTAHYSDGTSGGVTSYTLSGTLTVGTSTVTVNYGGKSTTFNVNVDDGGSILYALPHATEFNGTSDYIDTEVQLRKEDISFTIFFHVSENESGDTNTRTILHCMHEASPYDGLTFKYASSNFNFICGTGASAIFTIPESAILNDGIYAVITHEQGTSNYDVYYKTATRIQHKLLTYNFVSVDETMIIGAYQNTGGVKDRYFKGTIYDLSVRSDVASYQSICNYLAVDSTPNLVYGLPDTAVFNGTSDYIDTNVQLFAKDVGFALLIDATLDANTSSNQTLMHCMYEQLPYPGMVLHTPSGGLRLSIGSTNTELTNWRLGYRGRIGIVKRAFENMVDIYYVNSGDASISHSSSEQSVDYTNNTMLIGAYRTTSDVKGRFMKGTVYDFKIYTGNVPTDTVTEWVQGGME